MSVRVVVTLVLKISLSALSSHALRWPCEERLRCRRARKKRWHLPFYWKREPKPLRTASRPPRERWEEARGGRRPQPTMEDPSPDGRRADDGEAEQTRRARRGREQDVAEISRRMYETRLGAAGTRGTMWKTASAASPPSGGRPRLVADHTHKEPCTKTAGRGPVPFYPSPSRGVRVIYLFTAICVSASWLVRGPWSLETASGVSHDISLLMVFQKYLKIQEELDSGVWRAHVTKLRVPSLPTWPGRAPQRSAPPLLPQHGRGRLVASRDRLPPEPASSPPLPVDARRCGGRQRHGFHRVGRADAEQRADAVRLCAEPVGGAAAGQLQLRPRPLRRLDRPADGVREGLDAGGRHRGRLRSRDPRRASVRDG